MEDLEYLETRTTLQNLAQLIAEKDWKGFIEYHERLEKLEKLIAPDDGNSQAFEKIKDLAAHMVRIKALVLEQVAIASALTR